MSILWAFISILISNLLMKTKFLSPNFSAKAILSLSATVLCILLMAGNLSAQCNFIYNDADGNAVSVAVSCDFPVLNNSGDVDADEQNYIAQKEAWVLANPQSSEFHKFSYYEIHQADFDAMPAERQAGILAKPGIYHVIP
jgi:hypothetical protein